jgi:hypothetical protein
MLCGPHCSQLPTMLNNIVTPDSGSRILFNIVDKLASVNNVGSTTLFNPVKQRAQRFYLCSETKGLRSKFSLYFSGSCILTKENLL